MFFRSPSATFSSGITSAVFSTASLSPVRELSLIFTDQLSRIRASAVMRSPASRSRISPGTTSGEGTCTLMPPRSRVADGELMALRDSRDFSALRYCTVPSTALRISTAKITSELSP